MPSRNIWPSTRRSSLDGDSSGVRSKALFLRWFGMGKRRGWGVSCAIPSAPSLIGADLVPRPLKNNGHLLPSDAILQL